MEAELSFVADDIGAWFQGAAALQNARAARDRAIGEQRLAFAEGQRAIAEGRYQDARANLANVQAQAQLQRMQQLSLFIEQQRREMQRLETQTRENEQLGDRALSQDAAIRSFLLNGRTRPIDSSSRFWPKLKLMMASLSYEDYARIVSVEVTAEECSKAHYLPNKENDYWHECDATDVGQLLYYLERRDYSVRWQSPPYRKLFQAIDALRTTAPVGTAAAQRVAELQAETERIRMGHHDIWELSDIIGSFWAPATLPGG